MIQVLIADDHSPFGEALRALLGDEADMEVVAVALDGATAVSLADELQPDVVVMDVMMPGVSGIDATLRIVAQRPESQVLGISLYANEGLVARMMAAGARGFVPKDSPIGDLLAAIRGLAAGHLQ